MNQKTNTPSISVDVEASGPVKQRLTLQDVAGRRAEDQSGRLFLDDDNLMRFLSFVHPIESGCWLWMGSRTKQEGYGTFYFDGQMRKATRISHETFKGPLGSLLCCHSCNVKLCVNPDHLHGGTNSDNQIDSVWDGSHARSKKRLATAHPTRRWKLTESDIPHVLYLWNRGTPAVLIGRAFGVSGHLISAVGNGRTWQRLQEHTTP